MIHLIRWLLLIFLIISLPLPVSVRAAVTQPAPASLMDLNTFVWYDGQREYSTINNCVSITQGLPYQEYGASAYVGFLADPNAARPAPTITYYVRVVIAGLGDACGGMRAFVEISLPASTVPAMNATDHVYCFLDGVQISPASNCPQSLPPSINHPGVYVIPSPDAASANTWSIPQGHTLEFEIPVKSGFPLTNSQLHANVWMLDGNSSPWLGPVQGVTVFGSQPAILYPSPSADNITTNSVMSHATLYAFGSGGAVYFDLGTPPTYSLLTIPGIITPGFTAWQLTSSWQSYPFQPDTLYHWRARFVPTTGAPITGADQTFLMLPNGRVTIGQGQAVACNETAFNSALAAAKEIWFDCGSLPVTIKLTSSHSIASILTINGGNKVTLDMGGAGNHFTVQAGGNLTLTKITLSKGLNKTDCGGSIQVVAGGQLTLNETRFDSNKANAQGGAICNWGIANISSTLFTNNASLLSHGGAIGNYDTLTVTNSKFMNNAAAFNGGAIDMGGNVAVTNSVFTSNTAGYRGGGINTYGGALTVVASSFTSNTAGLWGGGLANDSSITTVTDSTFSDNSSADIGGGVETSGTGSLILTNSTVSANRATNDGGGLYWYPGATGPVTILNSTIANNAAGALAQGGNIYVGGTGVYNASINLKNTIIVGGGPNNCSGTLLSLGNNLENTHTCGLTTAGDKINLAPKLGPLQYNGGSTLTHMLLFGSPAIDAGSGCPAADQRGVARPIDGNRDGSVLCDIGALEILPWWPVFLPSVWK